MPGQPAEKDINMRIVSIAAIAAFTLGAGLAGTVSANAQSAPSHHGKVFGYQDAQTGVFHPFAQGATTPVTTPPATGKFVFTFDVTNESVAKGAIILCGATVTVEDAVIVTTPPSETTVGYIESGAGTVVSGGPGTTSTCTVTIPYSWKLPPVPTGAKATSNLSASYHVSGYNAPGTSISELSLEVLRDSESTIPIANAIPKDGATTAETIDVTI
jgi:hypothetical protein